MKFAVSSPGTLLNSKAMAYQSRRPARGSNVAIVTTYISDYIFPTIIRGIEETLRIGWKLLSILPRSELSRVSDKVLDAHYTGTAG